MNDEKLVITPKLRGDDGYKVFSVRVKEEIVTQIDVIVKKTGRSRNELIGKFLEFALEKCVIGVEDSKL